MMFIIMQKILFVSKKKSRKSEFKFLVRSDGNGLKFFRYADFDATFVYANPFIAS